MRARVRPLIVEEHLNDMRFMTALMVDVLERCAMNSRCEQNSLSADFSVLL
jgi:hypothetical protein